MTRPAGKFTTIISAFALAVTGAFASAPAYAGGNDDGGGDWSNGGGDNGGSRGGYHGHDGGDQGGKGSGTGNANDNTAISRSNADANAVSKSISDAQATGGSANATAKGGTGIGYGGKGGQGGQGGQGGNAQGGNAQGGNAQGGNAQGGSASNGPVTNGGNSVNITDHVAASSAATVVPFNGPGFVGGDLCSKTETHSDGGVSLSFIFIGGSLNLGGKAVSGPDMDCAKAMWDARQKAAEAEGAAKKDVALIDGNAQILTAVVEHGSCDEGLVALLNASSPGAIAALGTDYKSGVETLKAGCEPKAAAAVVPPKPKAAVKTVNKHACQRPEPPKTCKPDEAAAPKG